MGIEILVYVLLYCIICILCISYFIRYYSIKVWFFWLLAKLQNIKNIKYYKNIDIEQYKLILQNTVKGKFIEYYIATPAWYPIISLESCDNELWTLVKTNFIYFVQCFNRLEKQHSLSYYIEFFIIEYRNQNKIIDSILISKITLQSICKYLFDYTLNTVELECIYISSLEWKKQIAMKGSANIKLKQTAINIILNIIQNNLAIYNIFLDNWKKPEYYSVIMQPFIISPMINIPDIMCNAEILLIQKKITINDSITNIFIDRIIYSFHPFPILERYDPKTDTQYFIPLDALTNFDNFDKHTKMLSFGYGERKCAGQYYAYQILSPFLKQYFEFSHSFDPTQNHLYSGRINDTRTTIYQLIYIAFTLVNILFRVIYNFIKIV